MQNFIDEHPEYRDTYDLLESIDKHSERRKEDSQLMGHEDLKLYKYIYKGRLYKKKSVSNYLHLLLDALLGEERQRLSLIENSCSRIEFMQDNILMQDFHIENLRNKLYATKKEKPTVVGATDTTETKVLKMFLGKKVFFNDFQEKEFFLSHFKGLRRLFRRGGDKEFVLQDLFLNFKRAVDTPQDKEKLNRTLLELGEDKMLLYFYFLSPHLTDSTKECVFDRAPTAHKKIVLETLPTDKAHRKIAEVILKETPTNKVLFLNSVEIEDKLRVYFHLVALTMTKPLDSKRFLRETLDILKILPIDRRASLLVLVGWSKSFIYFKNVEEGIKLYKGIIKIVGKEEETNWKATLTDYATGREVEHDALDDLVVLSEFYKSVVQYKETGHLNFGNFVSLAHEINDNNIFCPFKWKEISLLYK